jgi:hypothetical protein
MADYHPMKTGDTSPPVVYDMTDLEGTVDSVTFSMRKPGSTAVKVDGAAATFLEVSSTSIRGFYEWIEADVDEEGTFFAEFDVFYTDGTKTTYPNDGHLFVVFTASVD